MKYLFSFLLLTSVFACHSPETADKTTDVFAYYLRNAFGSSIPKENRSYILVPENGCKGCRQSELTLLREAIGEKRNDAIEYIFSSKVAVPPSFANSTQLKIDSLCLIDKINLPISNITIIRTENEKVTLLKEITADRMDSIGIYLK